MFPSTNKSVVLYGFPPVGASYQIMFVPTACKSATVGSSTAQNSWVLSSVVGVGVSLIVTVTSSLTELSQPLGPLSAAYTILPSSRKYVVFCRFPPVGASYQIMFVPT